MMHRYNWKDVRMRDALLDLKQNVCLYIAERSVCVDPMYSYGFSTVGSKPALALSYFGLFTIIKVY